MSDGDLGPAPTTTGGQPGVLLGEVVLPVHATDRAGRLDQHRGSTICCRAGYPPGVRFPADSLIAGASPAHAAS